MTQQSVTDNLVQWFSGISDGIWGSASLKHLVASMNVPMAERTEFIGHLETIFLDREFRDGLKFQHGVDAKVSSLDGNVIQVHLRRTKPMTTVVAPVEIPKVKPRDPRLPPVGTPFTVKQTPAAGYLSSYVVTETPNGIFKISYTKGLSQHGGSAKSLVGAARWILTDYKGTEHKTKVNAYRFFGLDEPEKTEDTLVTKVRSVTKTWDNYIDGLRNQTAVQHWGKEDITAASPVETEKANVENKPLPVKNQCVCGKGLDTDGDGNCPACAHTPDLNDGIRKWFDRKVEQSIQKESVSSEIPNWEIHILKEGYTGTRSVSVSQIPEPLQSHMTRPSALWGAVLKCHEGKWYAKARGLVALGKTPEEAMSNWDLLFRTGKDVL